MSQSDSVSFQEKDLMVMAAMEKQLEVFRSGQESAQAEVPALEVVLEEVRAETASRIKEQEGAT